jgi:flagellar biosynthetic protein FliR
MLTEFLVTHAFGGMLVFARIGTAFMFMPGISASYVSARVRVLLALAVTAALYPSVIPYLPPMPDSVWRLVLLVVAEGFYGGFMGLLAQLALSALHFAGTAIGRDSGLMNAMVFDPVTEQQGALVVGLLSNVAVVLIFALDLHHLMFMALYQSYTLFTPGSTPDGGLHLTMAVDILSRSAFLALRLAAPFLMFAVVFQTTMGLMARISPQMNIFFIALPLQIFLGLAILWVSLPAIMMWFLSFYADVFRSFLPD